MKKELPTFSELADRCYDTAVKNYDVSLFALAMGSFLLLVGLIWWIFGLDKNIVFWTGLFAAIEFILSYIMYCSSKYMYKKSQEAKSLSKEYEQ